MSIGVKVGRSLRSSSTVKQAAELLSVIVVLLAVSVPLFSQAAVGTILGGVFDSTGGAIAGAKVTITDVARGTTRVLTTDDAGQFTAPSLLAGHLLGARRGQRIPGRWNTPTCVLECRPDVRVDLTLPPGEQTQTVTVTEEAPAIDTTNSTLGGTVTNQSVSSLPLVSRNFLQLLQLRPGVVDVPGGNGTATTTNGRREGADVLLVEGVTQFDLGTSNVLINGAQKGGAVDELPLDSVQEFSTQQNPSGGIWLERRIGRKRCRQVRNQQHSRLGLCLRPRCDGDRREAVLRGPGRPNWSATRPSSSLASRWVAPQSRTSSSGLSPANLSVSPVSIRLRSAVPSDRCSGGHSQYGGRDARPEPSLQHGGACNAL